MRCCRASPGWRAARAARCACAAGAGAGRGQPGGHRCLPRRHRRPGQHKEHAGARAGGRPGAPLLHPGRGRTRDWGAARRAVQCGDRAAAAAAPVLHVAAAPGQGRAVVRAAGHGEDHAGQGARPGPRRRARRRCRGPAALCPTRCPCRRPPCAGRAPPKPGRAGGAQALARQSGACFINVRPSTLQSKWFGDTQKLVQATFTLAYKIQPCIIFIGAARPRAAPSRLQRRARARRSAAGCRDARPIAYATISAARAAQTRWTRCWGGGATTSTRR